MVLCNRHHRKAGLPDQRKILQCGAGLDVGKSYCPFEGADSFDIDLDPISRLPGVRIRIGPSSDSGYAHDRTVVAAMVDQGGIARGDLGEMVSSLKVPYAVPIGFPGPDEVVEAERSGFGFEKPVHVTKAYLARRALGKTQV